MVPNAHPETERTILNGRPGRFCQKSLNRKRRQARFCTDACRTRFGRGLRTNRIERLLESIVRSAQEVRAELVRSLTATDPIAVNHSTHRLQRHLKTSGSGL